MKIADIRTKTPDELKQDLLDLSKERFNLRFQRASGQLENTARMRQARRDMARIKTVLAERSRAPQEAAPAATTKSVKKPSKPKKSARS